MGGAGPDGEHSLTFEDGAKVSSGWTERISTNGTTTTIANDSALAPAHQEPVGDGRLQHRGRLSAGGDRAGPRSRAFEWRADGWLRPSTLDLFADAKQAYLLHSLDTATSDSTPFPLAAARLRRTSGWIFRRPRGQEAGRLCRARTA